MSKAPPLVYRVRARNTATASANKIHDDDVARTYGFSGGLVPGVTTFAYMTWPVVECFGIEWLERGSIAARFTRPIYDGQEISVTASPKAGESSLTLEANNRDGAVCATGWASLPPMAPTIDLSAYPAAPLESPPPAAAPESFGAASMLGSVEGIFSADDAQAFLDLVDDDLPLYSERRIAHPGWLLTWANLALTSNFRLGPWIHTSSDVQWFGAVNDGDALGTRGRVAKTFERKGHRFVELDVLLVAGEGRPVMQVRHVAIYEPRTAART